MTDVVHMATNIVRLYLRMFHCDIVCAEALLDKLPLNTLYINNKLHSPDMEPYSETSQFDNIGKDGVRIPPTITVLEGKDGCKVWFSSGILHRDGGPAVFVPRKSSGAHATEIYFKRGIVHRTDGPAWCSENGEKRWYVNGLLHREDGPAIQSPTDGDSYYLRGKKLPMREYIKWFESKFCKPKSREYRTLASNSTPEPARNRK